MRGHPGSVDLVHYREGRRYIVMRDSDEVLIVSALQVQVDIELVGGATAARLCTRQP
jgi:hypothetical protein